MKKTLTTTAIFAGLVSVAIAAAPATVKYLAPEDGSYTPNPAIGAGEGAPFVEYKDVSATFGGTTASELVIDGDATLTADTQWILPEILFVINGTLTIEPGTIIRGEQVSGGATFDPGALVITKTAQIDAQGTPVAPIIFTTAALDAGAGVPDLSSYDHSVDTSADFLDVDPAVTPLSPGVGFSTTAGDTTHTALDYYGLWGGLIILGKAPTNVGSLVAGPALSAGYGTNSVEGLDPSIVGDLGVYGGQNPNDDSGALTYVSVRHGGANLAADNEINGITFGGVGFGTLVEFVEIYCNADDAFEWFGGTVNTSNLISLFNNDDSFDIDEGFTGLGQFWFSMMLDDGTNGDRAAEHDGTTTGIVSAGLRGLPEAFSTVYNATYIGGGVDGRITEQTVPTTTVDEGIKGEMFQLRDNWGGAYFNSIFVDAPYWAINIADDGDERFDDGDYIFRGNIWYNFNMAKTTATSHDFGDGVATTSPVGVSNTTSEIAGPGTSEKGSADRQDDNYFRALAILDGNDDIDLDGDGTVDVDLADGIFANNFTGSDPFLIRRFFGDFDRRAGLDPRPQSSVPVVNNTAGNFEPYTATYFAPVSYKGAFPTSGLIWTDGWSVADLKGYVK